MKFDLQKTFDMVLQNRAKAKQRADIARSEVPSAERDLESWNNCIKDLMDIYPELEDKENFK